MSIHNIFKYKFSFPLMLLAQTVGLYYVLCKKFQIHDYYYNLYENVEFGFLDTVVYD